MAVPSTEALNEEAPAAAGQSDAGEGRGRRNYDGLMRAQAEALNQISKQVIAAGPRPRDGLESAMSRMEARLAVTEQALAALDQRLGERLKGLDGDTNALAERLHGLRQRLEKFEEKQLTALAQLRLDVYNLRHPQPRSEAEVPRSDTEMPRSEEQVPLREGDLLPPEPGIDDEPGNSDDEAVAGEEKRADTYLDTARKAAIEAAERAAALPPKRPSPWKPLWLRRRWLAVVVAAVLVVWFDAYVFAHYQPAQGAVAEQTPSALLFEPHRSFSARAELVRGLAYLNGVGGPVDSVRAKLWIERAALRGHPVAENLMGAFSQTGPGASMARAIGWYETAARHGNRKAMTNLGKLYAGGWRDGTDYAKAANWFAKAAAAGDVDAAFDLAILYERGLGISRDVAEAYKWYAIAAGSGDRHAAARATVLAGQIAPAERDGLDRAILAFKPKPVDRTANELPLVKG